MFGAAGNAMLQDIANKRKTRASQAAYTNAYGAGYNPAGNATTKSVTGDVGKKVVKKSKVAKSPGMFKNPKRAAMIGLGLGVATSVAMNRRGKGVSPGNQSNARY